MQLLLPEVLDQFKAAPTAVEKVMVLRKHHTPQLRLLLQYALYPGFKWAWGNEVPPYKKNIAPTAMTPTSLFSEMRRMYLFTDSPLTAHVPLKKKEILLIQILENVSAIEAELIEDLIKGNVPSKYGITYSIAVAAFPQLKLQGYEPPTKSHAPVVPEVVPRPEKSKITELFKDPEFQKELQKEAESTSLDMDGGIPFGAFGVPEDFNPNQFLDERPQIPEAAALAETEQERVKEVVEKPAPTKRAATASKKTTAKAKATKKASKPKAAVKKKIAATKKPKAKAKAKK